MLSHKRDEAGHTTPLAASRGQQQRTAKVHMWGYSVSQNSPGWLTGRIACTCQAEYLRPSFDTALGHPFVVVWLVWYVRVLSEVTGKGMKEKYELEKILVWKAERKGRTERREWFKPWPGKGKKTKSSKTEMWIIKTGENWRLLSCGITIFTYCSYLLRKVALFVYTTWVSWSDWAGQTLWGQKKNNKKPLTQTHCTVLMPLPLVVSPHSGRVEVFLVWGLFFKVHKICTNSCSTLHFAFI